MTLPVNWREPAHIDVRTVFATGFTVVDEILQRRGLADSEAALAWLNPDLEEWADSTQVPGLDAAVERIHRAAQSGERVLIFGDYDCDGITSTAILYSALKFASTDHKGIGWMLPSREAGYGLREVQLERVQAFEPNLLILVDCGSNDVETVAAVTESGADVVVIDHHQISAEQPDAVIVANPQRDPGCPATVMTAAGLAWLTVFKLGTLGATICRNGDGHARYLDLAAIGTIADVAPLTDINRAIVKAGIPTLQKTGREGLKALARDARFDLKTIRAEDVPFSLTSLLNSPGRIASPDVVMRLLTVPDMDRAMEAARTVVGLHKQRKILGDQVAEEAVIAAESLLEDRVLVVSGDSWNQGVLGPVASKLVERYQRPVVVLGGDGEILTGSGRSVPGWNIAAAFREVGELVVHSGGHSAAAGLSVRRELLDVFRGAINAYEQDVPFSDPIPEQVLDAEVENGRLPYGMIDVIEQMGPFGRGNPRPLFLWRDVHLMNVRVVGKTGTVANMEIGNLDYSVGAVLFKEAARLGTPSSDLRFDVVIEPSISEWNNKKRMQVRLVDFQLSD